MVAVALLAVAACSAPEPPPVVELGDHGSASGAPDADGSPGPPDAPAAELTPPDDPGAPAALASLGPAELAGALRTAPARLAGLVTGRSRTRLEARDPHHPTIELVVDCAWDLEAASFSCSTWILEGGDLLDAATIAVQPGAVHHQIPHDPVPGTAPGPHRPSPAPWVPHPGGAPAQPFTEDTLAWSTSGPMALLLGVGDRAEVVGGGDVGGVPTVAVTATLDVARALDAAPPEVAGDLAAHLGDWAGPGERAVAVWLDAGGVPRRMRLDLPTDPLDPPPLDPVDPAGLVAATGDADGARTALTVELVDLGQAVELALPPVPEGEGG